MTTMVDPRPGVRGSKFSNAPERKREMSEQVVIYWVQLSTNLRVLCNFKI